MINERFDILIAPFGDGEFYRLEDIEQGEVLLERVAFDNPKKYRPTEDYRSISLRDLNYKIRTFFGEDYARSNNRLNPTPRD